MSEVLSEWLGSIDYGETNLMQTKREYLSGQDRQGRLDEQADERKADQKKADSDTDERVRRNIQEHGA
jgi:hypothetical protein